MSADSLAAIGNAAASVPAAAASSAPRQPRPPSVVDTGPTPNPNPVLVALPTPSLDVNPANTVTSSNTDNSTPDAAALKKSVETLNNFVQPRQGNIEFNLDTTTGKTLLQVVDTETNTVLLQIPSKLALALAQDAGSTTQGLLIKSSA